MRARVQAQTQRTRRKYRTRSVTCIINAMCALYTLNRTECVQDTLQKGIARATHIARSKPCSNAERCMRADSHVHARAYRRTHTLVSACANTQRRRDLCDNCGGGPRRCGGDGGRKCGGTAGRRRLQQANAALVTAVHRHLAVLVRGACALGAGEYCASAPKGTGEYCAWVTASAVLRYRRVLASTALRPCAFCPPVRESAPNGMTRVLPSTARRVSTYTHKVGR